MTLVIPVEHDGRCLVEAVASACGARPPADRREVLVAGGAVPPEVVTPLPEGVRYVAGPMENLSARLNLAVASARGRVLAFVDDDCVVPPDYFEKLSAALDRSPDVEMIGGRDELAEGASPFDLALDHVLNSRLGARGFRRPARGDSSLYSPKLWNMAIRREALDLVARSRDGGPPPVFDETLRVHQDVELARRLRRAGLTVRYEPALVVAHRRETTLRSTIRRNFHMGRTGRRTGIQMWPHRLVVCATVLFPVLLFCGLLAGLTALVRTRSPRVAVLVPVVVVSIAAARSAGYLYPGRKSSEAES